jgi:hypothetical protein
MDCDKESRIKGTNGRDEISSWSSRIYVYRSMKYREEERKLKACNLNTKILKLQE